MAAEALPIKPSKDDEYDFISPKHGTKNAAAGKSVMVTGAGSGIGEVYGGQNTFS